VPAAGVVEAFDVPKDPHSGGFAGREAFAPEQLLLEAGNERLGESLTFF
jgi:hypothetical protein